MKRVVRGPVRERENRLLQLLGQPGCELAQMKTLFRMLYLREALPGCCKRVKSIGNEPFVGERKCFDEEGTY